MFDTWKLVQEDKYNHYRALMMMFPLARTPMDKKGGAELSRYQKSLERAFSVPWGPEERRRRENLRGKLKPGEVMVILDADESPDDPLFKDLPIVKE